MTDKFTSSESPFACNMNAIPASERLQHMETARQVFAAVEAVQELPDGYAFRLPLDPSLIQKSAEFIAREMLCCPFFGFEIQIEPEGGPFWLRLSGREGVKPFIREEIGPALTEKIAREM